jgi:micrococcal nuclease
MRRKTIVRLGSAALGVVALLLAGSAGAAEPAKPLPVVAGKVTHVNDGDSLEVELSSGRVRVRMSAIDTPEYDQPYGAKSSAALRALLPIGTPVELEVVTQDQFRRMVATIWRVDGDKRVNVNEAMLLQGHAWAYRRYMKEPRYCDLEDEARAKKLGLWAQPVGDWVYPPEWRFFKNGEIRTLPAPYAETHAKCIEVLGQAGAATYESPK